MKKIILSLLLLSCSISSAATIEQLSYPVDKNTSTISINFGDTTKPAYRKITYQYVSMKIDTYSGNTIHAPKDGIVKQITHLTPLSSTIVLEHCDVYGEHYTSTISNIYNIPTEIIIGKVVDEDSIIGYVSTTFIQFSVRNAPYTQNASYLYLPVTSSWLPATMSKDTTLYSPEYFINPVLHLK